MTHWHKTLYHELDRWNFDGIAAAFWWRDDDAQAPTEPLDRQLTLAQRYHARLTLAVIPDGVDAALAAHLPADVTVLQHGFAHTNHAPPSDKKAELGDHRPPSAVLDELATGTATLRQIFGTQFLPILTPPWNRISPTLTAQLATKGFAGLSTFGPRTATEPAPGIRAVNTHIDLIDWRNARQFIGADRATAAIVHHLKARRHAQLPAEPTGLLTHHLVQDPAADAYLTQLLAALDEHPAATWRTATAAFGL